MFPEMLFHKNHKPMQKTMPPKAFNAKPIITVMLQSTLEFEVEEFFNENSGSFFNKIDRDIAHFPKAIEKSPALEIAIIDLPEDETVTEEQVFYFSRTKPYYWKNKVKIDLAHVAQICQMRVIKGESDENGELSLKPNYPNLFFMYDEHHNRYLVEIWNDGAHWNLSISVYMPAGKLKPGSRIFFIELKKKK